MRRISVAVFVCMLTLLAFPQTRPSKWQSGTVTAVEPHTAAKADNTSPNQYDVSVKVGDTVYVVLYTPPPGSNLVEYRVGASTQVLIEKDTLTFNDLLGRTNTLPVLRRDVIREQTRQ